MTPYTFDSDVSKTHRLADSAGNLDQRADRELGRLLVHDTEDTRARHHQDLRRIRLPQLMLGDPVQRFGPQLLLEQACG
jgi:hypothetical protein